MPDQETFSAQQIAADPATITVLLVDDQRFVAIVVERLFASEPDIQLHYCQKAADALALANAINPTVILQDLVLPDVDGLTMVRLFRENPRTAATPVIVLSGNDDASSRARASAEGARDYLVKLPAREDLVACVRRHATGPAAVLSTNAAPATAPPCAEAAETLDRRVLAEFRQAGPACAPFIVTLIDGFIAEARVHVETLRIARARRDAPALTATAHSLKGTSMTIGAKRLAALCAQVEEQAALPPGGAITLDLMSAVSRELINVQEALVAERQNGSH